MKKKIIRNIIMGVVVLVLFLGIFITNFRHELIAYVSTGAFGLQDKNSVKLYDNASWFDDYYTVDYIDKNTIAIGEPRYHQQNVSYLIIGKEKAILFDSGPGERDIWPVAKKLTKLPIISMCSHYHYDHVGNFDKTKTEEFILADTQLEGQELSDKNILKPTRESHLSILEGHKAPEIQISKTVSDGDIINLGGRSIQVISTSGHSSSSISLYDSERNLLFTGDYFYKGSLLATPIISKSANLDEYRQSTESLLKTIDKDTDIYGGHTNDWLNPKLSYQDLVDLNTFLIGKKNNTTPKTEKINDNLSISY